MLQPKPLRLFRADLNVGDSHEVVLVYGGRPSQVSSSGGPQPATPEAAEDVQGATLFWSYTLHLLSYSATQKQKLSFCIALLQHHDKQI